MTTSQHLETHLNGTLASLRESQAQQALQPKTTEQKPQSCAVLQPSKLPIQTSPDGQKAVVLEIYQRFHAMKTWGKEPESLDGITQTMLRDLAPYPAEKILKAFSTHATRSGEFPTSFDLVSLIKRNGKPPIKESDVIAVRKKDGEDRTPSDWQLLRDWEDQNSDGWEEEPEPVKLQAKQDENLALRAKIRRLEADNERMGQELLNLKRFAPRDPVAPENKAYNTLRFMKQNGVSEAELEETAKSLHVSLAEFEMAERGLR